MKVLIVDDEIKARETIAQMIHLYFGNEMTIYMAEDIDTAVNTIRSKSPDLLLLDIQLKNSSSFDLLKKINPEEQNIIFITAYEEYAIRACKLSALDYLLKPIDPDELQEALNKAKKKISKDQLLDRLSVFLHNMEATKPQERKITLKTSSNIYIVAVSEIVYCEADGNYTTFHLMDKQAIMVSKPLGDYEELLGSDSFIRTHQSFLVNKHQIIRYDRADGGTLVTVTDDIIPISSRKKEQVTQFLSSI